MAGMLQAYLMSVRVAVHGPVFVSVLVLMLDVVVLMSVVQVGVLQVAMGVLVRVWCVVVVVFTVVVVRHGWLISPVRWRAASIRATPLQQQPGGSWRRGDAAAPPGRHARR